MDAWKFLKIVIAYFESTYFRFYHFAKAIEWMTIGPDYFMQLYYRKNRIRYLSGRISLKAIYYFFQL